RRGDVAGSAALADGPRVLRADPARRPPAEEDRGRGDGALPGAGDVGAAKAGHRLAGERGPGQVAPIRARREGWTQRRESGDTRPWGSPEGEAFFRRKPPQPK